MNDIIEYIREKYDPVSVIVYGSYADGTNNRNSDFDAMVVSRNHGRLHDVSFVNGIQLDVFVYPVSYFEDELDCDELLGIYDGKILLDADGFGEKVKERVIANIENQAPKGDDEINEQISWCRKMLLRTKRGDAEGMFRWHWVLIDSLEFFCDAVGHFYRGPKKTLRWMESAYPEGFMYYKDALFRFDEDSLEKWIVYLERYIRPMSVDS